MSRWHELVAILNAARTTPDSCVLATALDAHMRDLNCLVPSDCTEAMTDARKAAALTVLRGARIDTRASRTIDLD